MLEDLLAEDYDRLRKIKRDAVEDAIAFASVRTKARYDQKHTAITLAVGDYVYLTLYHGYRISGLNNRKLAEQRVGPFRIIRKVSNLAYEIDLPPTMRIHLVISIAQLEPAKHPDPYNRGHQEPPPVENESDDAPSFEVEKLLSKRVTPGGKIKYLVKWKGWGPEHNAWYSMESLSDAMDLVQEFNAKEAEGRVATKGRRRE